MSVPHDPFSPPLPAAPPAPQIPEARLRRLGMRDDELEAARVDFAALSEEDRRSAVEDLAHLSDDEVVALMREDRERAGLDPSGLRPGESPLTPDLSTVARALEWVQGDPERARVALVEERAGQARKTLVEPLEAILGGR